MRGIGFVALILFITGCGVITWPESVQTGFEDYSNDNGVLWVEIGGEPVLCSGQIDTLAFDGEYSTLAVNRNDVAFQYVIPKPRPDGKYLIEAWCKSTGSGNAAEVDAVLLSAGEQKLVAVANASAGLSNGWERRELLVQLPPNHQADSLLIRLINRSDEPVWFDNFKLEFLDKVYYPEFDFEETVQIRISDPDLERLREKRLRAFEAGYLDMNKEDWVRCEIQYGDTVQKGSLTLKGDDLKNLEGDKWSFKIELDEGSLLGMRYFSIHNPALRNFLDEWLFHEILAKDHVVTPKYGFTAVTLNGRSLGVYAYEERIIDESFVHRDTVNAIARFKDLGWAISRQDSSVDDNSNDPFLSADIEIFREDSFDNAMRKKFRAQIEQFRAVAPGVAEFFNAPKTARLLALCDVMRAYHALHWTNIRFVSEIATGKIELVGNDAFNGSSYHSFEEGLFMAYSSQPVLKESERWKAMYLNLFNDKEFLSAYMDALANCTSMQFWDITKLNTFGELKYYQSLIIEEWPAYHFQFSPLYSRSRRIQRSLEEFKTSMESHQPKYHFSDISE